MTLKTPPLSPVVHAKPIKSLLRTVLMAWFVGCFANGAVAQKENSPALQQDGWAMAEVIVDSALIHQKPNDVSFITSTVPQGELLWIKNISDESAWFLVRPEKGALSWILDTDISEIRKGEGRVKSPTARVRPGRVGAKLPGPPGLELNQGANVWLLPREPLVLPQREGLITWRAIEPPSAELRYVRKENLRLIEKKNAKPLPAEGFVTAKGPGSLARAIPQTGPEQSKSTKPVTQPDKAPRPDLPMDQPPDPLTQPAKPTIDSLVILEAPGSSSTKMPSTDQDAPLPGPKPTERPSAFDRALPLDDANSAARPSSDTPIELPADADQALEILDSRFRLIVSQPLVAWDFQSFLKSCDQLARQPLSTAQAARLGALREKARAQDEIGASSRKFWDSMRRSRSHDPSNDGAATSPAVSRKPRFDITGLMLPSRRDIDGQLLYNLIGDTGTTTAYLKLPPASPVEKWLGKRVGVRGRVRYNEELRARLVVVQDLELLDPVDE